MRRVPGFKLWIGNAHTLGRTIASKMPEAAAVVNLAQEEYPIRPRRESIDHRFPLVDTSGNSPDLLRQAIDTVAGLIRDGVPTLICCSPGMSRSAAIAAAAIAQSLNQNATQTLGEVCSACDVDVSAPLWIEIHSAMHAKGDPVLDAPPKTGRLAPKREEPTEKDWPWSD